MASHLGMSTPLRVFREVAEQEHRPWDGHAEPMTESSDNYPAQCREASQLNGT